MKIKVVKNLKLGLGFRDFDIENAVKKAIRLKRGEIKVKILKKSLDARKKEGLCFVLCVEVEFSKDAVYDKKAVDIEEKIEYIPQKAKDRVRVGVVGAGPCGLFCALALAESGVAVTVFERGEKIEDRTTRVNAFFEGGELNTESNVQFGEGGAGAFSDGKLNTRTKNPRQSYVFNKFVECGAPECILYDAHPHIGTDKLKPTVIGLRQKIISLGGEFKFGAKVTDFIIKNSELKGVKYIQNGEECEFICDYAVLATGHSARDIFEVLKDKTLLTQKAFSVGVRIEHLQEKINIAQFGKEIGIPSEYKLSRMLRDNRGVYTFCMCPGGVVVAGSSEKGGVVTNGMSNFARDEKNSNSAVLVSVLPTDFGSNDPLAGVEYQRKLERLAYRTGGENYKAPVQRVGDFLKDKKSVAFGEVLPSYPRGVEFASLKEILPEYVTNGLKEGILSFDNKLKGFANGDALLTGVESRSSSPVRIQRGEDYTAIDIKNLYPAGEGAGYAGGITSSAVDGVTVAEAIVNKING